MNPQTTKETLVREIVDTSYDGKSVTTLEKIEVEIAWPHLGVHHWTVRSSNEV